ncbi:MAG: nucleotidyltransferase [Chloroflexi bacterium]|nr:nucleotidyltransferase [Chloroflexota bacterium]
MNFEIPRQDLTPLEKALTSFLRLYARVADEEFMSQQDEVIRLGLEAGLIQNFEFTYELCWKAIKRWLENNISPDAADGVTRRELFRMAAENRLIPDVTAWMTYHAARNEASHRYGMEMAQEVMAKLADFGRAAQHLLAQLQARND